MLKASLVDADVDVLADVSVDRIKLSLIFNARKVLRVSGCSRYKQRALARTMRVLCRSCLGLLHSSKSHLSKTTVAVQQTVVGRHVSFCTE